MLRLQSLGLLSQKDPWTRAANPPSQNTSLPSGRQAELPVENNAGLRVDVAEDMLQISACRDQVIYSTSCGQHVHVSIKPPARMGRS